MLGSSVPTAKRAILDLLGQSFTDVALAWSAPERPDDERGPLAPRGISEAIWFDDATGTTTPVTLGLPVMLEEQATLPLHIQVMHAFSLGTQEVVETRAAEILGIVVTAISAEPGLRVNLSYTGFGFFRCLVESWAQTNGPIGNMGGTNLGHGSSYVLNLQITARLAAC